MTSSKNRIIKNILSLSVLQGFNYIVPLITIPYLVRVLGPEKFGLIAFAQAFIQYFIIFTNYGFNFSASRSTSNNRLNMDKVSEIFSAVITIKVVLAGLSLLALIILAATVSLFHTERYVYFYSFGTVIGSVLFPIWFFQGMEDMKFITLFNMAAKFTSTIAIFVFIKNQDDYIFVPLIYSLGQIIGGGGAFLMAWRKFDIKFRLPTRLFLIDQMKEGWHIFTAMAISSLYTTSNTVIIGIFTNNTIVGYYSAGDKLVKAVTGLINPVTQGVYPHISFLVSKSKEQAIALLSRLTYLTSTATILISICLFSFAPYLVNLFLGSQFHESIMVVKILSPLPFVTGLSGFTGVITMFNFSMESQNFKILLAGGAINILSACILIPPYKQNGLAVCVLITEIFITGAIFYVFKLNGIHLFKRKAVV